MRKPSLALRREALFHHHRKRSQTTLLSFSVASDHSRSSDMFSESASAFLRRTLVAALFLSAAALSCLVLLRASNSLPFLPRYSAVSSDALNHILPSAANDSAKDGKEYRLERVLKNAAMKDKTVILTTLNDAWAAPNSVIDLFLESFRIGERTRRLLNHMVIIALDQKAFSRCLELHPHCFALVTEDVDFSAEAKYMSADYLKMMWRRIDFLRSVLEMGYSFVFTDADIMWFRDPFSRFYLDADFQIACDHFVGNSSDTANIPNGGFNYVRSNNQSIAFYKFWHSSRLNHPGFHDQDVLNFIKSDPYITEIGVRISFLDTAYFGGLCEPSKNLNEVCTMHANCCIGLDSKLHDLRVMLRDWRQFMSLPPDLKITSSVTWKVPQNCSLKFLQNHDKGG